MLPQRQRLALVGSSQGITLSFLISSLIQASLSVFHPLCIGLLVVMSVLDYPATILRSPGQVPKVAIQRNGDVRTFAKGHKRATTEFMDANDGVPLKIHLQAQPELEPEFTSETESTNTNSLRGLFIPQHLPSKRFTCSVFAGSDESI